MDIRVEELQLKLQRGKPVLSDNILVYPLTIGEIEDLGYVRYLELINSVVNDIRENETFKEIIEEGNDLIIYDIALTFDGVLQDTFLEAIKLFTKSDRIEIDRFAQIKLYDSNGVSKIMNRDSFKKFARVVKLLHSMLKVEDFIKEQELEAPDFVEDEKARKAREIRQKLEKSRETIKRLKEAKGEASDGDITFTSIISSVCTKSNHINRHNVWDLTLYQLYDEFNRLTMIDNYQVSIDSMLAGASEVELQHWASNL